jgi:hypothetical protein
MYVLKQKRVDYVVVSSKLHVSERSTAPYVVSTSQPPADRTTIATLSQQYVCMYIFRPGAHWPRKVSYWSTGRAELGVYLCANYKMLLAAAGLVIRDAKLDVSVEVQFLQEH